MAAPGLYLHVPFCSAICPYCDFAVQVGNAVKARRFVDGLCREIETVADGWRQLAEPSPATESSVAEAFDTVYFGGGTPSFLEADGLQRILEQLRQHLPVADDATLFLEANPEDIDRQRLDDWRRLGVDTLSIGVQSFDDATLAFLGRRHRADEAQRAIDLARDAGFRTLSLDLMYGLPGQSEASWQHTLEQALALKPDHLSCYELEIHRRTPFGKQHAKGQLHPMPDGQQADLFVATHRYLAEQGYQGYEISNFARSPEHQSRHNRKYWDHTPYLGIGPSAHSFASNQRWWNEPSFATWKRHLDSDRSPRAGEETLQGTDLALERLMLALRTRRGVDLQEMQQIYGCDLMQLNAEPIERYLAAGWLHHEEGCLRPSLEGWVVADALAAGLSVGVSSTYVAAISQRVTK